jgi:hypothetical protein
MELCVEDSEPSELGGVPGEDVLAAAVGMGSVLAALRGWHRRRESPFLINPDALFADDS